MTISRKIYTSLREQIISGKFQPGHMLGEQTLADEYQSSKMPVREALHLLCQEGYLVSYPRRGYVVSNITEEDYLSVQQVRLPLELLAVSLIVANASDAEIKALYKVLPKETNERITAAQFHASNYAFHISLAQLSKNKRLISILDHLLGEVSRAAYRYYSVPPERRQEHHKEIVDALMERNEEKTARFLRDDLNIIDV